MVHNKPFVARLFYDSGGFPPISNCHQHLSCSKICSKIVTNLHLVGKCLQFQQRSWTDGNDRRVLQFQQEAGQMVTTEGATDLAIAWWSPPPALNNNISRVQQIHHVKYQQQQHHHPRGCCRL
jgi:hypothetical protein